MNDQSNRRQVLKILGAAPLAVASAQEKKAVVPAPAYKPKALTPREFRTTKVLADLIIPADERSGSASQAGAPEFIDAYLAEVKGRVETQIRGGLAWLDSEAIRRFEKDFVVCTVAQQKAILDLIAYPAKAAPEHRRAVLFFNRFRDLTASGFYTSKMGTKDLGYMGNTAVSEWNGCPDVVLRKLGLA